MTNEEDDKPTVVLDISALKEQLKKSKEVEIIDQDIEFSIHDDTQGSISTINDEASIIFFDYNSSYFSKLIEKLPQAEYKYECISDLKSLNTTLQSGDKAILFFNYVAAPKVVNQLTTQIKEKFPKVKTVIVAKGLSQENANEHKQSKAGANSYLSIPFSINQFLKAIEDLKQ